MNYHNKYMQKKTIGIVGGGQLGRMLTDAAHKLGFKVVVLDPQANSPAGQKADEQILGDFKNRDDILRLAKVSDFITFETESADSGALEELIARGMSVNPDPKVLKIIKDKFNQKAFFRKNNIPVADFALIESETDAEKQGEIFGYPFLLKARFDAYDGRGNFVVKSMSDIEVAFQKLSKSPLYAEKFVPFIKELAVVSARDTFNTIESFEVVETIHENNICHVVRSPAPVSEEVKSKAKDLARQVLENLGGVGVFAVEMFLEASGNILVNEVAPRVHNSGHHTIEQYSASQFEQHIRAITGMHIVRPELRSSAVVMVNILGEREGEAKYTDRGDTASDSGVYVHIYGKLETRKERKMGHITVTGDNMDDVEKIALQARKHISI